MSPDPAKCSSKLGVWSSSHLLLQLPCGSISGLGMLSNSTHLCIMFITRLTLNKPLFWPSACIYGLLRRVHAVITCRLEQPRMLTLIKVSKSQGLLINSRTNIHKVIVLTRAPPPFPFTLKKHSCGLKCKRE